MIQRRPIHCGTCRSIHHIHQVLGHFAASLWTGFDPTNIVVGVLAIQHMMQRNWNHLCAGYVDARNGLVKHFINDRLQLAWIPIVVQSLERWIGPAMAGHFVGMVNHANENLVGLGLGDETFYVTLCAGSKQVAQVAQARWHAA